MNISPEYYTVKSSLLVSEARQSVKCCMTITDVEAGSNGNKDKRTLATNVFDTDQPRKKKKRVKT